MCEKHSAGVSVNELINEYSISPAAIYRHVKVYQAKKASGSGNRNHLICDIGHRFVSNLSPENATCPTCSSRSITREEDQEVTET
jgi:hypothetical protein